jgi:acetyl-CoA carboxylase alpha subunit
VIRKLPKMQRIVVARFQHRPEAEHYLKTLRRMLPNATHELVFEPAIVPAVPVTLTPMLEDAAFS